MSLNKNQRIIVDWLSNTGQDYMSDLAELEGAFDSVPEEVHEAFLALSAIQKIEMVKKAASKNGRARNNRLRRWLGERQEGSH